MKLKIFLAVLLSVLIFAVTGQALAISWCHTFNTNLGYAQSNSNDIATKLEVMSLHVALLDQGISYDPDGAVTYSTGTSEGAKQFQSKYFISPQSGWTGPLTRTKLNQLYGCTSSGNPSVSVPACTESNWTYVLSPSTCPSFEMQTKTWTRIGNCTGGTTHPASETIFCNYKPSVPVCLSFTYSNWSLCASSGVKTRTVVSSYPAGCAGGNPVLSQSCVSNTTDANTNTDTNTNINTNTCVPDWVCSDWSDCANSQQTKICVDFNGCAVLTNKPSETQSCAMPPTVDIKAWVATRADLSDGPILISSNKGVYLQWTSSNVDSCVASGGWIGTKNTTNSAGFYTGQLTSSQTYTISCAGAGGTVTDSVTVNPTISPITDIKAENVNGPITISNNGTATLSWETANVSSCSLIPVTYCVGCNPDYEVEGTPESVLDHGTKSVTLSYSQYVPKKSYIISCKDSSGNIVSDTVLVNVSQLNAPSVALRANGRLSSAAIFEGNSVSLTWTSSGADTCTASEKWSGSKSVSGSETVTMPDFSGLTYEYSLTCSGPTGKAESSVKVSRIP